MNNSATLAATRTLGATALPGAIARIGPGIGLRRLAVVTMLASLLGAGAWVAIRQPYGAGSPLGYNLGLVGGVLMLLLLPYALRKRLRCLRNVGTMRGWFLFHIAAGLLGPLLVLFHSTFRIGSFNGGVALASTLLVTFSGVVGRFLYRKVHRGLSGNRMSLGELEAKLQRQLDALQPHFEMLPAIGADARCYIDHAISQPGRRWQRATHFLSLGGRRHVVRRRIRRFVRTEAPDALRAGGEGHHHIAQLLHTIDAVTAIAQRTAQFSTYERLFVLWHVVHIPFLFLLVLSAVVHVIAVHAY